GLGQSGEGQTRRARQGQVRGEPAYGIAGEEGIDAEVNDLRLGPGPPEIGEPRHVRLHDEDHVSFLQVGRGIEAGVQGMVLGEIDVGIGLLEDGRAERLRQGHEGGNGARVAPGRLDDDEGLPAAARSCAASATTSGAGTTGPGVTARAGSAYSKVSCRSDSTSRGRVRYTGPCGSAWASVRARSTTVSSWEKPRSS